MALLRILVSGATGKQGGATVRALAKVNELSETGPRFQILAVTRNPDSAAAKKLADLPHVQLVKGDLNDPAALFKAAGPDIHGVFSVQVAIGQGATVVTEERQGKALADEAQKAGVKHFVYTSVDRGNIQGTTGVPHFDSKLHVENHIRDLKTLPWTFLRPVAFMDVFFDPNAAIFATLLKNKIRPHVKLQTIDSTDIGHFAALAFSQPDEWIGKELSLAGDDLTFTEMAALYENEMGYPLKVSFALLGTVVNFLVKELRLMFAFFDEHGFSVDIATCKAIHPGLHNFSAFLQSRKNEQH